MYVDSYFVDSITLQLYKFIDFQISDLQISIEKYIFIFLIK